MITESEVLGDPTLAAQAHMGTAGWDGFDSVLDAGELDTKTGETGTDFVRVTLFAGHPAGQPKSQSGGANGKQVLARMPVGASVPAKDQHVLVLFPTGYEECGGAGVCWAVGAPSKAKLPNVKDGEVVIPGPAGQLLRMPQDGSVMFGILEEDGTRSYWRLAPGDGEELSTPHLRRMAGPNGYDAWHSSGAGFGFGALAGVGGALAGLGSYITIKGDMARVHGTATSLGTDGGAANFAAVTALKAIVDQLALAIVTGGIDPQGGTVTFANAGAVGTTVAAYDTLSLDIGKVA